MNPTTTDLHVPSETRLGDFHPLGNSEHDYSIVNADVATVTTTAEPSPQHRLPDVDLSQATLTDEQRQKPEALLLTYSVVFSAHNQDYECTETQTQHRHSRCAPPPSDREHTEPHPTSGQR